MDALAEEELIVMSCFAGLRAVFCGTNPSPLPGDTRPQRSEHRISYEPTLSMRCLDFCYSFLRVQKTSGTIND